MIQTCHYCAQSIREGEALLVAVPSATPGQAVTIATCHTAFLVGKFNRLDRAS